MALKIEWSNNAENTYLEILDYLHNKWTEKEVAAFIKRTDKLLAIILKEPYGF